MRGTRRTKFLVVFAGLSLVAAAGCQVIDKSSGRAVAKVVVVGDSVMDAAFPDIKATFGAWGVDVRFVGKPTTGPLWKQKAWATMLTNELASFRADIVIFESCCSYPGGNAALGNANFVTAKGVEVLPDTDLMFTEWEAAERELIDIARKAGASPWWVKLPPANETTRFYGLTFPERMARINTIVDGLGVPILDWGSAVMAQPNVASLRYGDGIHYYPAGYKFLASYSFTTTVKVTA